MIKSEAFLDSETTLAIWAKANQKGFWNPSYPYSNFTSLSVESDYNEYLENFAEIFADVSDFEGFCFPLDWAFTGAIVVELDELMRHLNAYMFSFEDEMRFFSTDFTKAIILQGDRSGSGEKLNELSVSVSGTDWLGKWKKGSESV